jgi:hypothetical protein
MRDTNERPFCHRAEDLVTYLYGEAGDADAADFRNHLQQCDACRGEFTVFNQVHDSILLWRNEALGASFNPAVLETQAAIESTQVVRHERKLSALAALREFFSVSPLWLRGATAFAGLVLCVLVVLAVSRPWQRPAPVSASSGAKIYTQADLDAIVARTVKTEIDKMQQVSSPPANTSTTAQSTSRRAEVASVHSSARSRVKGLTRQEREQLAADLRLIPGTDDEELPFALPEEPNQ